jgi:hypothetical protein
MDNVAKGSTGTIVKASDGRLVNASNQKMPGGGWVSTHEDVTEQRRALEERAAVQDQEQRREIIDGAIASFRPLVEKLLSTVSESATTMRSTAAALFGSSEQTSQRAESAVHAFHEASVNVETAAVAADELSRSIAEISRQLGQTNEVVGIATGEARATDGEIAGLASGAQKIGDVIKLIRDIAGQTNLLALNATIEAARGEIACGADLEGDRGHRQPHPGGAGFNRRRGRGDPPDHDPHAGNQPVHRGRRGLGRAAECGDQ